MKTEILAIGDESLRRASARIRSGGIVAFGTETVYGLGADARNPDAIREVFRVKGRPMDNPLIVHLSEAKDIPTVCEISSDLLARLETVMPAPLTVILPKKEDIPYEATAGLDSVGVRVPASEGARAFIKACGVPVAAPSANTSTRPSPTTARHVYDDLNGKIGLILDSGPCDIGVESTVVDFTHDRPRVLRLGGMTVERLIEIFGEIEVPENAPSDRPLSPGMKYRHYAPDIPVILLDKDRYDEADRLCCADKDRRPVIMATDDVLTRFGKQEVYSLGPDAKSAAHNLFGALRALEKDYGEIITFRFDDVGYGRAVNNRLEKASRGKS